MLLVLEAIAASGVMATYISEWRRRDTDDQTLENFHKHFERANKVRIDELTTKQAGYHQANSTTARSTPTAPKLAERFLPWYTPWQPRIYENSHKYGTRSYHTRIQPTVPHC